MQSTPHPAVPARILLVEDERKLASIVARALTGQGYLVDVVVRGDDALDRLLAPDAPWSLVVLDRMLPGIDGVAISQRLRAAGRSVPILMLTAMREVDDRVDGLDAGADDYLTKPLALRELYARVRSLLRARGYDAPEAPAVAPRREVGAHEHLEVGDLRLDVEGLVAFRGDARIDLRPKEAAILATLMRHPDRIVERWVIQEAAWGDVDVPSSNHLDVHMRRIRDKVDRPFDRASIETMRGAGYRIRGDGR